MDNYNEYNNTNQGGIPNSSTPNAGVQSENVNTNANANANANPYQQRNPYYQSNTGYQNNTGAYQNQAGNTYQSNAGNAYQNNAGNAYQNNAGNTYQSTTQKEPKKKHERRKTSGGFGTKVAKCAALALVFGLVAGTAFEGVRFASGQLFPQTSEGSSSSGSVLAKNSDDSLETTSVSSTYAAAGVSDVVDQVMPSIVSITNISETEYRNYWGGGTQTYESTSAGSGIIVSEDNDYLYIATNNHVVENATSLTVAFSDGSTVSADIKGTDPSTDLAVIRVAKSSVESDTLGNIKVATLGDSDALSVGDACIAIGNALGYGQSVTGGYISALNRQVSVSDSSTGTNYTAELIQTDAAINPGNSGGALLNAKGEVIGINSVKYSDTSVEGIGYAIPINTAAPIIQDLITKEKVDASESAYLGIAGVDVTSDVAKTYNMPTGVYVAQVVEGSAAEQAGIVSGDIITEFDGKTITSMEGLSGTLEYYKAGTTVDVTVMRNANGEYTEQTISVTLGKKN